METEGDSVESVDQIIRAAVKRIEQEHKLRVQLISVRRDVNDSCISKVLVEGEAL